MGKIKTVLKKLATRVKRLRWPRDYLRIGAVLAACLILSSTILPLLERLHDRSIYQLSESAQKVVGTANTNLSAKFSYDEKTDAWQFNKDGQMVRAAQIAKQQGTSVTEVASALSQMKSQVGGGGKKDKSLYSVDLPTDAAKGVTFYDNQTSQSFKMVPQFKMGEGKKWQDRIIYPFADKGQIVYTAKTNGIKEDIVLNKFIGDSLTYSYKLELPDTLEARLQDDGSVGVFSADPALYSNMTYGADADREKVESARKTAAKNHLVFAVPAPIVKDSANKELGAAYTLKNNVLTLTANRLDTLKYPISIDPSVVITSSSDFKNGNDEGMISYGTSNQISRSDVSGATLTGSWSSTSSVNLTRFGQATATYNGYMYVLGGAAPTVKSDVQYSAIGSDGTLGAWHYTHDSTDDNTTFVSGFSTARYDMGAVAYNGYIYIIGGNDGSSNLNDVQYAPLNSNGTVGTWASTTSVTGVRYGLEAVAYNGYMYVLGGWSGSSYLSDVQYAPINANGTVGAWTSTTSFTTARSHHSTVVFNGYLYVLGGTNGSPISTVQYAPTNADGTVGAWTSTTSFTTARTDQAAVAYNGYMYIYGGYNGTSTYYNDVQIALINANGSIGPWRTTTAFTTARRALSSAVYNGYIYLLAGTNGTNQSDVQYHKIDPIGTISNVTLSSVNATVAVNGGYTVAYNGYLYHIGGFSTVGETAVRYAAINADGSYGSWTANPTSLNTAAWYGGYGIWNGKLYLFGGFSIDVVQYATFNNNGTLSAWSTTTVVPSGCGNHSGTIYNGYIYYVCGTGNGYTTTIRYAPINSDGTVGTWATTSSKQDSTTFEGVIAYGGYLYVLGGSISGVDSANVEYAQINSDGTVGTWAYTTDMNQAVSYTTGIGVHNGYMYRMGGEVTADVKTTEYTPINTNGTLGTWVYSNDLTVTAQKQTLTIYGDTFYLISGAQNGARSTSSYYGKINSGGGGQAGAWTTNATSLSSPYPNGTSSGGSFVYGGYAYMVGGYNATTGRTAAVFSAPINADGSIGSWTTLTSMNTARNNFVLSVYNGYVYVYTGTVAAGNSNTYEYAQLGSGGTIGSWTSDATMNLAAGSVPVRANASGTAYNGYLYVTGGIDSTTYYSSVYYAPLNGNGSVGTWVAANSFTTGRYGHSTVAYNGYMYNMAGITAASTYTNNVQYTVINGDGTLGTWANTAGLLQERAQGLAAASNGYMYIYTGTSGLGGLRTAEQATINANGTLGNWGSSGVDEFTNQRIISHGFIHKGTVYLLGGYGSGTYYTDIQYAPLAAAARIATYSKLISLPSGGTISAVNYNGSLSPLSTVQYRKASSNGVLGSLQSGISGAGSDSGSTCVAGSDQYVWLYVTLDDSMTVKYGSGYTPSNLTDITVYYGFSKRPTPPQRLFGGKSFQNEILQEHDTCGP